MPAKAGTTNATTCTKAGPTEHQATFTVLVSSIFVIGMTLDSEAVLEIDGAAAEAAPAGAPARPAGSPPVLPIGIDTLSSAALLDFDVYIQQDQDEPLTLYRARNYPLQDDDFERLRARGVRTLYIQTGDVAGYQGYLQKHVFRNERLSPIRRYNVLREASRAIFIQAMESGDDDQSVAMSKELGRQVVETICRPDVIFLDLFQVMARDYSAYTHAMNVSASCLALAQALGIRDNKVLVEIGQGALLHDYGKRSGPAAAAEKGGAAAERERQFLLQHPLRAFRDLCRRPDLTWPQLMMVYQHHERCDGRGYPCGLTRPEIHDFARLCAVVNVYDGLLRGAAAGPRGPAEVPLALQRQAGSALDEEMTRCLLATLQLRR